MTVLRRAAVGSTLFGLLISCSAAPVVVTPSPEASVSASQSPGQATDVGDLVAATVQVDIYVADADGDGEPDFAGHGSGTILTADGLILTNAHVAAPDAPGQAVQYGQPGPEDPVERLVIRMTESEDSPPVERYRASVVAVDGYLDVAVIQVDATADGQSLDPDTLDLPFIAIGDSDAQHIGDPLIVVGFPGIGGETVSVDHGDVSGFLEDSHVGQRGWIKTSAVVYHGNSGGLAANSAGEIVGIPTRAPDEANANDVGGFQLVRPINLAKPVIQAAMDGTDYGDSPHIVGASGDEQVSFRGWGDPAATGCGQEDLVPGYPSGASTVQPLFDWSGIEPGEDVLVWLVKNPDDPQTGRVVRAVQRRWELEPSGTCWALTWGDEIGFEDGAYAAWLFVGPNLEFAAEGTMTIPTRTTPGDDEVTLTGSIVDAGTGQPITDAAIFVLEPGTDAAAWNADPNVDQVAASGDAGADGSYTLEPALRVGEEYPLLIFASGYADWIGTLTVGAGDTIGPVGLTRLTQ